MSKSWQEILREYVAAAQLTPEQRQRAALACHEALHRRYQALVAEKGAPVLFNLPMWPDDSSGTVSAEDVRLCIEEIRKISDEDLKRAGLERVPGGLVFSDFALNTDVVCDCKCHKPGAVVRHAVPCCGRGRRKARPKRGR